MKFKSFVMSVGTCQRGKVTADGVLIVCVATLMGITVLAAAGVTTEAALEFILNSLASAFNLI